MSYRIGQGIDFHRLEAGRDLWIGGIKIPHEKGAVGHSDADVLLHAICDAMLGAINLGDIGLHFPDTEQAYKNIDSKVLLQRTYNMVREKGYHLVNIDCTILLEAPKIRPYVEQMRTAISQTLHVQADVISIKATTTERMGEIGSNDGIAALANVLLQKY